MVSMLLTTKALFCMIISYIEYFGIVQCGLSFPQVSSNLFSVHTETVEAVNGTTVQLGCSIKMNLNFSQFQNVTWIKAPRQMLTKGVFQVTGDKRFHLVPQNILNTRVFNLIIDPVQESDGGEYRCNLLRGRKIYSKVVVLVVKVPPKIIRAPPPVVKVDEHKMAEVFCNATGRPYPNVTWYAVFKTYQRTVKKPVKSALATFDSSVYTLDGSLIISPVYRKMTGTYRCEASNGIYPEDHRDTSLIVQFAPEVEMSNSIIKQYLRGKTVIMCKISAFPTGIVEWLFEDRPLQPPMCGVLENRGIKHCTVEHRPIHYDILSPLISKLTIFDISKDDFGSYGCKMQTIMGIGRGDTKLEEFDPDNSLITYDDKFKYQERDPGSENPATLKRALVLPLEDNSGGRQRTTPPINEESEFRRNFRNGKAKNDASYVPALSFVLVIAPISLVLRYYHV